MAGYQLPSKIDFSPVYAANAALGRAKQAVYTQKGLEIQEKARKMEYKYQMINAGLNIASAAVGLGQTLYGIVKDRNTQAASLELAQLRDKEQSAVQAARHNGTLIEKRVEYPDGTTGIEVELPPEIEEAHKQALEGMKEKYGFTPEVVSWAQTRATEDHSAIKQKALAAHYADSDAARRKLLAEDLDRAAATGDDNKVAEVLATAASWLTGDEIELLKASGAKAADTARFTASVATISRTQGVDAAVKAIDASDKTEDQKVSARTAALSIYKEELTVKTEGAKQVFQAAIERGDMTAKQARDAALSGMSSEYADLVAPQIDKLQADAAHNRTFGLLAAGGNTPEAAAAILAQLRDRKSALSADYYGDDNAVTQEQKQQDMAYLEAQAAKGAGSEESKSQAADEAISHYLSRGEDHWDFQTTLKAIEALDYGPGKLKLLEKYRGYLPDDLRALYDSYTAKDSEFMKGLKTDEERREVSAKVLQAVLDIQRTETDGRNLEPEMVAAKLRPLFKGLTATEITKSQSALAKVGLASVLGKATIDNRKLVNAMTVLDNGGGFIVRTQEGKLGFAAPEDRDAVEKTGAILLMATSTALGSSPAATVDPRDPSSGPRFLPLLQQDKQGNPLSALPIILDRATGTEFKYIINGDKIELRARPAAGKGRTGDWIDPGDNVIRLGSKDALATYLNTAASRTSDVARYAAEHRFDTWAPGAH